MRYKKKEPAHIEERIVSTKTLCDGCGKPSDIGGAYEINEVTIEARLGDVYPEGDQRTVYDLDVCATCFKTKVIPALAAIGLRFRERDADDDERVFESDDPPKL